MTSCRPRALLILKNAEGAFRRIEALASRAFILRDACLRQALRMRKERSGLAC
jgi:hypothetical protein